MRMEWIWGILRIGWACHRTSNYYQPQLTVLSFYVEFFFHLVQLELAMTFILFICLLVKIHIFVESLCMNFRMAYISFSPCCLGFNLSENDFGVGGELVSYFFFFVFSFDFSMFSHGILCSVPFCLAAKIAMFKSFLWFLRAVSHPPGIYPTYFNSRSLIIRNA